MTLEPGDRTRFADVVQKIFGMKNPWPSAMKIMGSFDNPVWAMWNLVMLNERIVNPGDCEPLKTTYSRWGYLEWLRKNPCYTFKTLDYDAGLSVQELYEKIIPPDKTVPPPGMDSMKAIFRNLGK